MGYTKKILKPGNNKDVPKHGDEVTIQYTGNLWDQSKASDNYRGDEYGFMAAY